jgi:outer membrane protein insertion porin family
MRLRSIVIPSAVLAAATFIFGQAPTAYPLESLRVQGNEQFRSERILEAAGLKIGQAVAKADFNRARDRLLATGGFEKVGYEYKPSAAGTGYDAVFEVAETTPLYRYRFEELPSEAALRETLRKLEPLFDDRIPATPQVMNRFSQALAQSIGGGIQVIGDINSDTPGELMVLFRPMGARQNISEVNFKGNQVVETPDLTRAISGTAVGVGYSEPLFRQMLDLSVRPLYEERGRIRVAFPTIEVAKSTENRGLVIAVTVDEGPSYKLGEVEYRGVERRQVAALEKLADLPKDEVANFKQIAEAMARVRKQFREDGYLRVEAPVERVIQETEHVVNLVANIKPGPRYTMGKLTIVGLDILSEPVIRKMWQMQPGSPYRESYADSLLARIQAEDIFDNLDRTGAEAVIHDDTETVDVTLTFLGARAADQSQRDRRR